MYLPTRQDGVENLDKVKLLIGETTVERKSMTTAFYLDLIIIITDIIDVVIPISVKGKNAGAFFNNMFFLLTLLTITGITGTGIAFLDSRFLSCWQCSVQLSVLFHLVS